MQFCLLQMQLFPNGTRIHVIPRLSHIITVPIVTAFVELNKCAIMEIIALIYRGKCIVTNIVCDYDLKSAGKIYFINHMFTTLSNADSFELARQEMKTEILLHDSQFFN